MTFCRLFPKWLYIPFDRILFYWCSFRNFQNTKTQGPGWSQGIIMTSLEPLMLYKIQSLMQWGSTDFCFTRIGPCPEPFWSGWKILDTIREANQIPKKFGDDFGTQHFHSRYYHDNFLCYHNFLLLFLSFLFSKKLNCIFCFPQHPTNSKKNWQSSEVLEGSLQLFQAPGVHQDPPWHSLKLTIFVPWKMLKKKWEDSTSGKLGQKKAFQGRLLLVLWSPQKRWHQKLRKTYPKELRAFFGPNFWRNINVATKSGVEKIRAK